MSQTRTALVTGASTGFGYLTAERLAAEGFTVYATMRDLSGRNAEPRRKLEAQGITVLELDVTNQTSVDAVATRVLAEVPTLDVLVNNAGTAHMGVTEAFTPESVERQYATNVIGPVRMNRAFLPSMRAHKRGLVVFVTSVVGRFTLPFLGVYASSKFAVEAMAESMSYELRPFGVDVAIVEPGAYATNIFNVVIAPDDTARLAAYGEVGKAFDKMGAAMAEEAGDPIEVAHAVVQLSIQPQGTRPLRTSVPAGSPAEAINNAVAPIQRSIIEGFGFSAFLAPEATLV